ncbi:MAG: TolC family protein [Verrucomicrobiota bacterium]|nr:TolC family protein [Verrucomicrobiota bacterium]
MPAGFALPSAQAESVSNAPAVAAFTLKDYLRQVLRHNESIQAQRLEAEVNRRKARGELGAFEPQLEASIAREVNKRTNNVEQQAALAGQGFFSERNTLYDGGLETLIPTGGKIRLGYTLDDFVNNVNPYPFLGTTNNPFIQQYQTFVGATFTQPLLKNAGFAPTLASYRLAALDSDIAFEQYRRQLMLTVYQAESAYWNLDFAQEQVRFFDESVAVAREVLNDTRQKLKAGQGAELDVLEAQSALALRNTKRNEAVQGYYDALGRLQMLTGAWPDPHRPVSSSPEFRVLDDARTTNAPPDYESCFQQAFSLNPDYLIQEKKIRQDRVRYRVANNQLLPELDLKAAYGFNGLGANPDDSWQVAASEDYPSWSVGLELIVPLGGNLKGRNLYHAARLSLQESALKLRGVQTQIANTLNIAIRKARAWRQSIQSYRTVVRYNEELLKTELARLEAGTVDAHKVLEVEADLLDSRQDLAGALTQYRGALLEIEVSDGSILKDRGLDVTRDQLRRQAGPAALSRR